MKWNEKMKNDEVVSLGGFVQSYKYLNPFAKLHVDKISTRSNVYKENHIFKLLST